MKNGKQIFSKQNSADGPAWRPDCGRAPFPERSPSAEERAAGISASPAYRSSPLYTRSLTFG